jgi:hypothetical protein
MSGARLACASRRTAAVVVLAATCTAGTVAQAVSPGQIRCANDRVSVALDGVPLASALQAIAAAAGARLHGEVARPSDVTVVFDALPLRDALPRLLGDQNFTLTYGEGAS